ncbi:LOW QUALITY PROTEIN: transmembrane protein 168-like [Plectropomus leopardus]|uniref:LOW QUALITY PROTEIN: transmembrane protein 168-like n=1 Tax=Plectropomus leopardus TaxID=160734 RepID=UPI001C4BC289|nr:LOW QUALITY PROTEIN: transmembrane protein 168-like [Plectropomus leopardus]
MCRFLRYCVSHCLHAAMTRLEEVNGEVSMWSSVRWLGYLSGLNLLVALCLGLYTRWEKTAETTLLVIFVLALIVLGIASIVYYYFRMERVSLSLLHLWFGFLLGLQCFLNSADLERDVKEQAANYLLLASVALRTLWALLERLFGCAKYRPAFLTSAERLELVGFATASTALLIQKSLSVMVLVVALAMVMIALRMKALLALPNLVSFAVITAMLFFKSLNININPFALACFLSQLICDPLLDVYFSGLSVTERWQPFLVWRGLWRRLSLLPLLVVEVTFIILASQKLKDLDQWYLMIPSFVVCLLFWAICHTVFVITVWGFHTKLSECQRVCLSQGSGVSGLDKVMASKGMRHFCLISERLVLFSLVSTVAVAGLCWQASSSIFISMFLLVLPLESLFHGLFHELGNSLGGTCVGYAVVIPTNYCSPDGQPMLLPPDQVQELNRRSTGMLNNVQRFFAHHLIEAFGCDYSTSGITLDALQAKIKSFLELRTADGPRHDTYVIFYSGHSHRSGEWALAGGDTLRLDQILEWWREKNGSFCSRLILVLDCDNSLAWVKEVRRVEGLYVAVQGATLTRVTDIELQDPPQLGDFTSQWVEYNCNSNSDIRWSERGRAVCAAYGISKEWGDYKLHLPTGSDVTNHWSIYFPRITYPVVQLALWCGGLNVLWLCSVCLQCLKRIKLNWFPPAILDTGQGFKLVRS